MGLLPIAHQAERQQVTSMAHRRWSKKYVHRSFIIDMPRFFLHMRHMSDEDFMRIAIDEARSAGEKGEIPVGAIIVREGTILVRAGNINRASCDPTRHAEMEAIRAASRVLGNERLTYCELFVTKEPCAMCAGAIVHARIARLIIGTRDTKYGACGTVLSVCGNSPLNHVPEIVFGILEEESACLLSTFFENLRKKSG